jgi:hypothetical protein
MLGCIVVKRQASFGCFLTTILPLEHTASYIYIGEHCALLLCFSAGASLTALYKPTSSLPSFTSSVKMSTRRARGHYSPLICTRCRARKIKCILPTSVTSPSTTPQPLNQACQRCRQNGFECLVEYTVLGRPGSSRIAGSSRNDRLSQVPIGADGDGGAELGTGEFLLSWPYDLGMRANRIRAEEVCEALSSPLRFLSVLLSRHPTFGRDKGHHGSWAGPVKLDQVISLSIQESLESTYAPFLEMKALLMAGWSGIEPTIPTYRH